MTTETTTTIATSPPANATEASARLGALTADKEWSGKLLAGDVEVTREFKELSAKVGSGDVIDGVMAGLDPGPDSDARLMADVATDLRAKGVSDGAIRQLLTDQKVSAQEYAAVKLWKAERMTDPVFTKDYLAGELTAVREMTLANIVLNAEIEGK